MESEKPKKFGNGLEQFAASWVLRLAGSLLVLSVALNNIGFRLDKVLDAWSVAIVEETKAKYAASCPTVSLDTVAVELEVNNLKERLERVEGLAHKEGK